MIEKVESTKRARLKRGLSALSVPRKAPACPLWRKGFATREDRPSDSERRPESGQHGHNSFRFNTESPGMQLAYSAGVMKILHHRATRHFIALLVGCRCGRKFLHRLDRPVVACLQCGRIDNLGRIIEKLREAREAERRRAPKAARRARTRAA